MLNGSSAKVTVSDREFYFAYLMNRTVQTVNALLRNVHRIKRVIKQSSASALESTQMRGTAKSMMWRSEQGSLHTSVKQFMKYVVPDV
jgi:hypothetical protein